MNLLVALFCVDVLVVGIGCTYLSGVSATFEERLGWGTVLGTIALTLTCMVLTFLVGFGGGTVGLSVIVATGLSWFGWRRGAPLFVAEARDAWRRMRLPVTDPDSPLPLVVLFGVAAVVTLRILTQAYGTGADGGLTGGHLSVYGDWSVHLSYAGTFAYGDPGFPPELPIAAGHHFAYYFGADFFSAMFVPLGMSLPGSLQVSSALLALAFPVVMYTVGLRLLGSRLTAVLAVLIFTMAGGFGFTRFLGDAWDQGLGIMWNLPETYVFDNFDEHWIDNPVLGFMYPQRPTQIGFPVTLLSVALLWEARRSWSLRTFAFTGVLIGLMPIFHLHSFGTPLALGLFWALWDRRREWLVFLAPALILALPVVLFLRPDDSAIEWQLGWIVDTHDINFFRFWVINTGLFIPLVALAQVLFTTSDDRSNRELAVLFAPVWLWLLVPNLVKLHPWEGNNAKYIVYFLLFGSLFAAALLAQLVRTGPLGGLAAGVVLLTLVASGGLDLWQAADGTAGAYPVTLEGPGDLAAARWVRDNTEPDAVFATNWAVQNPLRDLTGRSVVAGRDGTIYDLGLEDWGQRISDTRTLLGGGGDADAAIERYGVDYVAIGPNDVGDPYFADPAAWDARGTLVYAVGGWRIYEVSP
ncbi:MAG: hypothetical protein KDB21_15590 [Acidimicrobiales bacterium]|nr:hypothetical protein [Acidimicrobiales bacterium]